MGKTATDSAVLPVRALHVSAPGVPYEDRPNEQELVSLLSRSPGLGGGAMRPLTDKQLVDLEHGVYCADDDDDRARWQVVKRFQPCASCHKCVPHDSESGSRCRTHVVELVQLNRANFGLRWRQAAPTRAVSAPRWMVGPHWYLMVTTWTVFALLALFVNLATFRMARIGETITGVLLSAACLSCYALVGCSDPGIVPRISTPPDDSYSYCDQCESFRPEGALHCHDCRVCIAGYDHHCPWTGKCVGQGNARYFYAWLVFLVLAFVYEVIEFTTYMLPANDRPIMVDSSDDSFDVVPPLFATTSPP